MALRAGSRRREVERRGVLGELLDHLATMARLLPTDGAVSSGLEQRICGAGVVLLRGELDRFDAAFRAQVLFGGTLGLVALLLYEVGSLPTFQGGPWVPGGRSGGHSWPASRSRSCSASSKG